MPVHYEDSDIVLLKTVCGSFGNNAYLLVAKATGEGVIIDTPGEPQGFIEEAEGAANRVAGILITHNHWDHLAGFEEIHHAFTAPV
ncbi:MAG: MBL fold metallo-hydrolase, partial [Chloroflexota bacterium]